MTTRYKFNVLPDDVSTVPDNDPWISFDDRAGNILDFFSRQVQLRKC